MTTDQLQELFLRVEKIEQDLEEIRETIREARLAIGDLVMRHRPA